jgi:hypothetical protein
MKKAFNISMLFVRPFLILYLSKLMLSVVSFSLKYQLYWYEIENDISASALNVLLSIFYVFIFNSLVLNLNSEDRVGQSAFIKKLKSSNKFSLPKFVLTTPFFYLEALLLFLIPLVFKSAFSFDFVTKMFFSEINPVSDETKRTALIVAVPVLLVVVFIAHYITAKNWLRGINGILEDLEKEKISVSFHTLKSLLFVFVIYLVGMSLVVYLWPAVASLVKVGQGKVIIQIALAIVLFTLLSIIFYFLRALLKRRTFIKKLKKYCKNNSLVLSEIINPYSSIFRDKKGFNFTVEKNGKKYDCKFLYSLFKGSPLVLSDKGLGIKHTLITLRGIRIFSKTTDFSYVFESDNKKILIILPIPKKILVSIRGTELTEADTGEKLGEYTIHSANSFLNALDRNCL